MAILTQAFIMKLGFQDSIPIIHQAILNEPRKHGSPLNWIVVDVDVDRQKAVIEALHHIEGTLSDS